MAAKIDYSPEAMDHLAALPKNDQVAIVDQVHRLLADQPTLPSRKRKRLMPNEVAQWELRLGDLRVFYDVATEEKQDGEQKTEQLAVTIKAIGKKSHNELWIGGKKVKL
jgi:mRNA-degrading endonuclease RelE of RelBE toxin-antitoxin system